MNRVGFPDDAPVDEVDEQLVAYLDGELPPDELRALEQRLGTDAALRARLRDLQIGWEMLDDLPLASSSNTLLETTIRMAAVAGDVNSGKGSSKLVKRKLSVVLWVGVATAGCFLLGLAITRGRDYLRYQKQLRDLPIAMHLDAYLRASDLVLMENLAQMPQWQAANEMADQLGKWDVSLANRIEAVSPKDREVLLPTLPVEDQKTVAAAWERFENVSPQDRQIAYDVAAKVAGHPDAKRILKTMDRFAIFRESVPVDDRDKLITGKDPEEFINTELKQTISQWTKESASQLSDDDIAAIYQALRQIARLRLKAIHRDASDEIKPLIESFGSSNQSMAPRDEAFFLRRMFDISYRGFPPRDNEQNGQPMSRPPGLPPNAGPTSAGPPMFAIIRGISDSLRGQLHDDELDMLQLVLPKKWADIADSASTAKGDRDAMLRDFAEEALKRVHWDRSGQTAAERYLRADEDREEIDLLPTDKLLRDSTATVSVAASAARSN